MPMKLLKDRECTADTPVSILGEHQKPIYGTGKRIRPHIEGRCSTPHDKKVYLPELLPLEAYDLIIVLLSGGKDSTAAFWSLIELGVPIEKIEIWHHDIDGSHPYRRMDWPVTAAYVRSFAEAVGAPLRPSWRVNGFFGELYRIGASYPIEYENNGKVVTCRLSPKQIKSEEIRESILQGIMSEDDLKALGNRMRFPAKSGDLARRWCSSALKIDVASAVIRRIGGNPQQLNAIEEYQQALQQLGCVQKFPAKGSIEAGRWCSPQLKRIVADSVIRSLVGQVNELDALGGNCRFPAKGTSQDGRWCSGKLKASIQNGVTADIDITKENINILVVSGERRGESPARSLYNEMELHATNATARAGRLVHHWRCVIDHSLKDIWTINRRHLTAPHPTYCIGWSRCSCMMCIFGMPCHWAGIRELFPEDYEAIRQDEITLGFTIDNKKDLDTYVGDAQSCVVHTDTKALWQTKTGIFTKEDVFLQAGKWKYPSGAFLGSEGGPC